ncbi:polygalacturonase-like [Olea europaea var. sylvestris]|uniref:polygalacturonase-like n=1 Tax=Olea europaea var. sylvestris TaxID=158386 RepID=UPI000C1D8270|nr:polygalacturonase-like [Olea europaea var. sylvestris]
MAGALSFILAFQYFLLTFFHYSSIATNANYNLQSFGAKSDGKTDCSKAFLSAWTSACASTQPATIFVPPGRYLLGATIFAGKSCKNTAITIQIDGTLVAPSDFNVIGNSGNWIKFESVTGVSVIGGTLDAQGANLWACKNSGKSCPTGATRKYNIIIGSLGWHLQEPGVENVTVKSATFTGTQNGARVKTWARPSNGFVKNILFQHLVMVNVENPIIIDQNYCPDDHNCPSQVSGVKISDVTYQDIHGSSATETAVKFDCIKGNPCSDITLEDVKLTYKNERAHSSCINAIGKSSGSVEPNSCLSL